MKKNILYLLLVVLPLTFYSQNLSISPYSGIGIGEIKFDQSVILNAMAGTSTTYVSDFGNELNFSNPAANKYLSVTTFNASVSNEMVQYKTDDLNENRSTSYISEISIGFPIAKKLNFGLGFQPFSATSYKVNQLYNDVTPNKFLQYEGKGGINSLHSFLSYNVNKNWSFGLKGTYLFGDIDKNQEIITDGADLVANYEDDYKIKGFQLTTGVLYSKPLKENKTLHFGATYGFNSKLNTEATNLQTTYYYTSGNVPLNIDTIYYNQEKTHSYLGSNASLGVALNKNFKYRIALDAQLKSAPEYNFERNYYTLNNGYKFAFGGWVIPDINSYKSYFERMVYRFGAYYQKGNLELNSKNINQFGITFGFGLPIGKQGYKDPSMVNLGFELGRRGTKNNNLIQENFANIKIGLNFNDRWFRKRKYN